MPIDPKQALGARLDPVPYAWDPDRIILYHLGVGAGDPPTDPNELAYTYEKNLKVLPSYGVIPAFPAMAGLIKVPGIQFNPALLLHGEQDIELRGPIPTLAKVVSSGKIAGIYDKKKAALVVLEVETKTEEGETLFVNRSSLFLRGEGGFGGAITAALFLQHFVPDGQAWAHLDLMAWNNRAQPGRPVGGEAMGLRSAYAMIKEWCHERNAG